MYDCQKLIHPFQTDPGVSQRQRIAEDLYETPPEIDGRSLADLLNYFVELSRHINYYDVSLSVSDWQPFFQKSIPFSIASMIKYDHRTVETKFKLYKKLFDKNPSPDGLQLQVYYVYYSLIDKINTWYRQVKGSELPVELAIIKLVRDQLRVPIKDFIQLTHCAVKWYCIRSVDFSRIEENDLWQLEELPPILPCDDESFKQKFKTRRQRLVALSDRLVGLFPSFLDVAATISQAATLSMEQSLVPLRDELKQNHTPHLAVIFAFLKLFRHLQNDLNSYSRKHLDFFYKDVLQLYAREAKPDHAHLILEVQNRLDHYLLTKGLLTKNGKDASKEEVYYALDDEIVINKTQVAEQRTLHLRNETIGDKTFIEGVYAAPNAGKADGVDKDFKEGELKSFVTLGSKESKYRDPETNFIKPHPKARQGFIMASPVLFLNEGTRTITITIECELFSSCRQVSIVSGGASPCCDGTENTTAQQQLIYPDFADSSAFYNLLVTSINGRYYYINRDLIGEAVKKGLDGNLASRIIYTFLTDSQKQCYCPTDVGKYEASIIETEIDAPDKDDPTKKAFSADELEMIKFYFSPRKTIRTYYSGKEKWLEPDSPSDISITPPVLPPSKRFTITIVSTFGAAKPSITFYDKEKLKEDFNTTLPLVKVELDDTMKILKDINASEISCCLERKSYGKNHEVSLYHFFRDVRLNSARITAQVCGLKNLIVQNSESVQDVNSPISPFGVRPKVNSSFFVGSKEVFSKNWQKVWLNVTWKDKPTDIQKQYKYYDYEPYEDGSTVITEASFRVKTSLLESGKWKTDGERRLFKEPGASQAVLCNHEPMQPFEDVYRYTNTDFAGKSYTPLSINSDSLLPLNVNSDYGFLRLMLKGVSFQHDRYAFVLARHMMVLAGLIDPASLVELRTLITEALGLVNNIKNRIEGIITRIATMEGRLSNTTSQLNDIVLLLAGLLTDIQTNNLPAALAKRNQINSKVGNAATPNTLLFDLDINVSALSEIKQRANFDLDGNPNTVNINTDGIRQLVNRLITVMGKIDGIVNFDPDEIGLPKEPYTPTIGEISIDYEAVAMIDDIVLVHLHPFIGTYKREEIELKPPLFPTFCDEGSLFLGLKDLKPGSNVNILFQLAEATADSEEEQQEINWSYLENNQWKLLREGFEVLNDATDGLTTSGIVKFALPANMTNDNTVLPKGLHWIKAAISKNSRSVSETIGIHTQAIRVTFTNEPRNDKQRLATALPPASISKLREADAAVKKISQPYESFGGRIPENSGHFYVRVSEQLRHKGRAIQRFDYERLALEAFPLLFRVKCINHSFGLNAHRFFNDFPVAPGYVILAVIPDLSQLKAANSFEPRAPVSMLDDIGEFLKKRTSPFARIRVMNPRYEKVRFGLRVKLYVGKDETYYKEKLIQDLREFMAPWVMGDFDKLAFAQCLYRSDIVRFLESRDYLDYIIELKMEHEEDVLARQEKTPCPEDELKVCPLTPRSILIAGDIDVCVDQGNCESWGDGVCENEIIRLVDYCKE